MIEIKIQCETVQQTLDAIEALNNGFAGFREVEAKINIAPLVSIPQIQNAPSVDDNSRRYEAPLKEKSKRGRPRRHNPNQQIKAPSPSATPHPPSPENALDAKVTAPNIAGASLGGSVHSPESKPPQSAVTKDHCKDLMQKVTDKHGTAQGIAKIRTDLNICGAGRLADMDPAKYEYFAALLTKHLA